MTAADDLAEAITDAVTEWLSERGGGIVTSFSACFEYVDSDGDRCWATAHHENQTPSQTLGLLRWHTLDAERQCVGLMDEGDE